MERLGICRLVRSLRMTAAVCAVGALAALAVGFVPGSAGAAPVQMPHASGTLTYWDTVEAGGCSGCHTLKPGEGDPNTSYIALAARTLNTIKFVAGSTPSNLGCTFCHNRQVAATKMKGVLGHFNGMLSQHPIGRTFVAGVSPAYTDTDNEFLSTYGSNTSNEMDCLDCHDAALVAPTGKYNQHQIDATANPYMLKGTFTGTFSKTSAQFATFCRSCHGATAPATFKGKDIRLSSHNDTTLVEIDGTALRTSQCVTCHNSHSSANAKLFAGSFGNGGDCTSVCHYSGDVAGNYNISGHGKPTSRYQDGGVFKPLNFACTRCHNSLDVSTKNSQTAPPRKLHAEKQLMPINGSQANYKALFNLSPDLLASDGGSRIGNPANGICQSCHAIGTYKPHVSYEGYNIGCQDCHDEHAEGAGANIFMLPATSKKAGYYTAPTVSPAGTEALTYVNPYFLPDKVTSTGGPYDFYRADGAGSCDNMECHTSSMTLNPDGTVKTPGPLNLFLTSGNHSGPTYTLGPNLDCEGCHTHGDVQGGWGAQASCDDCHGLQGRTHTNATESQATHTTHSNAAVAYVAGCQTCHLHDGKSVAPDGSGAHNNGTVDFGGPSMTPASSFNYTDSFSDANCNAAANQCHNTPPSGAWKAGLGTNTCQYCHGATGKTLASATPTSGLHALTELNMISGNRHDDQFKANPTEGAPGTAICATCHGTPPSTLHVDGTFQSSSPTINFVAGMNFIDGTPPSCAPSGALINCHADQGAWGRKWSTTAGIAGAPFTDPKCDNCHGMFVPLSPAGFVSGISVRHGGPDPGDQIASLHGAAGDLCYQCHSYGWASTYYNRTINWTRHRDGSIQLNNGNSFTDNGATVGCTACHVANDGLNDGQHSFQDTMTGSGGLNRWGRAFIAGPSAACDACHGYPPTSASDPANNKHATGATAVNHDQLHPGATGRDIILNNHDQCGVCHGNKDDGTSQHAPYVGKPGTYDVATDHRDNSIEMNGNLNAIAGDDAGYNQTNWGCDNAGCHSNDAAHRLTDSGLTVELNDYGAGACNGCHGNATGNYWPDSIPTASGGKGTVYPNRAGQHQAHVDAIALARFGGSTTAFKNQTCDSCHPSPGGGGHSTDVAPLGTADVHRDTVNTGTHFLNIKGATNSLTTESYNAATTVGGKSCSNVDCHYRTPTPSTGTAPNVGWYNSTQAVSCSSCHGSGTAGAGLPNAHQQHVGNAAGQKTYPCQYCHPSSAYTMAHQSGQVDWSFAGTLDPPPTRTETYNLLATGTTAVKYGSGAFSTCANLYCHIQTPSPLWSATISSTQCLLCHQKGQTAAPNPSSGLHYGATAPVVTGTWHDDLIGAGGCPTCHTSVTAQATHVNGTFDAANGQTTQMGLFADYRQSADGVGTCYGAPGVVGGVNCHGGSGEVGIWQRRWNSAIHYSATADVPCQGCHGGLGTLPANDWTFGTGAHLTTDGSVEHGYNLWDALAAADVIGQHSSVGTAPNTQDARCDTCHVYPKTPYLKNVGGKIGWVGNTSNNSTYHGNNSIEMNTTVGYATSGANQYGCTVNCHVAGAVKKMESGGWPVGLITGPASGCDSCHGYPPTSASDPANNKHASGATAVNHDQLHPGATGRDIILNNHDQCGICHGNKDDGTGQHAPYVSKPGTYVVATDHRDNSIEMNGNLNATAGDDAGYNQTNWGCDSAGCHSNDAAHRLTDSGLTVELDDYGAGACYACHGNDTGSASTATSWPDGIANNPSRPVTYDYADDAAGAHDKHINAIYTANSGSLPGTTITEKKNKTCTWCHPGNPPPGHPDSGSSPATLAEVTRMSADATYVGPPTAFDFWSYSSGATATSGTAVYFKSLTGVDDSDAFYNYTIKTCRNINCHSGNETPDWYNPGFVDSTPPYWPSGDGLTAVDSTTGGEVVVSWSAATDAASLPIRYDLYRNATCTGSPIAGATNLAVTSFADTGLTNNTAYSYCVRAKDAWTPYVEANNSVISTTPTSATPTLVVWTGGTTNMTYKLVSTTSAVSLGGISTGVKVCGTRLNGTWPSTPPAFYTGLLVPDATAYTCGASSANNAVLSNTSQTGNVFGVQHFLQNAYAKETTVTGQNNTSGFDIYIDAGSTSATMLMYFARLSPAGVIDQTVGPLGSSSALSTTVSRELANPSTLSITVPAGYRFGVVVGTNETTGSTAAPLLSLDTYNATVANNASVMVTEVQTSEVETTPPVFPGPLSAVDAASGGTVNLSWPAGTDTSLPIRYRVWWSTGAINYGAAPNATTTDTELTASGLTDNQLYNFGVRAVDAQNNVNTTQITATATPTAAPSATDCYACHNWPQTSGAHTTHKATTNPLINNAPCVPCHGSLSGYTTAHSNGTLDLPAVAYSGEPTPGVLNGTCSAVSCHYGSLTPAWNSTGLLNCTSCHQYPPATLAGAPGYSDHDAGLVMAGGVTEFKNAHNDCMGCHGVKSANTSGTGAMVRHANYPASMHGDGSVTMNGPDATPGPIAGTEYVDGSGWCAYACHAADANHSITPSTYTPNVNYGDFGLGACNYCHETGTFGAPAIPSAGAHAGSCDQCHPLHLIKSATTQVQIPNNTGVGINYATHGGIFLGGTGTKSTGWATANTPTEAEICWGCHDTQGISEWGVNNNAQTGSQAYNYGSLSTSNWRTATWTSGTALFSYKSAAIQSTHAASTAGGAVKGIDPLAAIRCSYCHDVHNRNLAPGDTTSGQPYLRGSWRGNPYPEDGAPQTGSSYPAYNATTNYWGAVPRGGPVAGTATGGFYIDQNSGNPVVTAAWTATQFGGLCDLCHGTTRDGAFTSAEVNVLNQYDANGVGWVSGTNGHVNSVGVAASGGGSHNATATTGGTNNQGNNIFAGRGGANNQTSTSASHPFMLFNGTNMPGDASGGFRGGSSQFRYTPAMGSTPMDGDGWANNQWNNLTLPAARTLDLTGATVNATYHSFSCSKCHNPHASRLPALMITNCLDTRHNAWDNGFQLNAATDTLINNRAISNWTSAQNCHRLGGVDTNAASPTYDSRADVSTVTTTPGNAGWNTVTPWQQ